MDGQAGGPKPTLTLICADPKPNPCGALTPQLLQSAKGDGRLENIQMASVVHPDGIRRGPDGICGACVNISEAFGEILMASWVHLEPILVASGSILEA